MKAEADAELDALLGGMGIDTKTTDNDAKKDTKQQINQPAASGDGQNKSKNQKKKEK